MMKNVTLFVLVVLGAIQVCTCKDIDDEANAQALQLIATMDKAYALFNESIANLTVKKNEYTTKGKKQIKEMTADVTSQINEEVSKQKKKAEKAGVDASACFTDVSNGGKHSVANITLGAKWCLSEEVCTCKDIDDEANAKAKALLATMNQALAIFGESIDNLTAKTEEYTSKGEQKIEEMTADVTSQINDAVDKLKKEAQQIGVIDASSCFAAVADGGDHSVANITSGAKVCLTREDDKMDDTVSELKLLRHNVNETIRQFNVFYYECDTDYDSKWEALWCKNDTLRRYTPEVEKFPKWEEEYLPPATALAENVVEELETCLEAEAQVESNEVEEIIKEMEQCVHSINK